uniref:Thioredoxin-like fold domain-containing protein n=1 Tax=Caldiarchaeum subterraneum TaxID=311458 RepID=E6NAK4_CALS0|nr:hypothetical protein HGMM_F01D06C27 [Candidatus Caldarchaeum subterraneum]BAJ49404.1 hypothetical protein HGMM_F31D11C36 [Candidatus Caldarchaeum subterraneum]
MVCCLLEKDIGPWVCCLLVAGLRRPVKIEVYDVYPMTLGHCPHYNLLAAEMYAAGAEFCELSTQAAEYPDDVIKSHQRAAEVVRFLRNVFRGRDMNVEVEMVNLISPTGFFKSILKKVWRRPAVVVDGVKVCEGGVDWERLRTAVEQAWLTRINTT